MAIYDTQQQAVGPSYAQQLLELLSQNLEGDALSEAEQLLELLLEKNPAPPTPTVAQDGRPGRIPSEREMRRMVAEGRARMAAKTQASLERRFPDISRMRVRG